MGEDAIDDAVGEDTPLPEDDTLRKFLAELASAAPTPGGGGAAALSGATGAALVSMVCNLTIGKKKYAAVEAEMRDLLARSEGLRAGLTGLIAQDVAAFGAVMSAHSAPRATDAERDARDRAIQAALKEATEVPLACCRACRAVIDLALVAAEKGNPNVVSDAGVAALQAQAGLRGAALNVTVNAKGIEDRDFAQERLDELEAILAEAGPLTERIYGIVRDAVR